MALRTVRPTGRDYLALVTDLLQRQRLADPLAGLFEAADLQWWYTRDQHEDEADAIFWLEGDVPVTAAVINQWSAHKYGCVVLGDVSVDTAWDFVQRRCAELDAESIEMEVDVTSAAQAMRAGFTEHIQTMGIGWLDADDRAAVRPLPDGYRLVPRPEQDGPHPMSARNGAGIEARLRECSLYDPELDLALLDPDGAVAGYAMFWADPRTHVGLIEPVRVEDGHSGQGLAGTLVRAGVHRLVAHGCDRLKVLHELDNPAADRAYAGAGFRTVQEVDVHRWTDGNDRAVRDVRSA